MPTYLKQLCLPASLEDTEQRTRILDSLQKNKTTYTTSEGKKTIDKDLKNLSELLQNAGVWQKEDYKMIEKIVIDVGEAVIQEIDKYQSKAEKEFNKKHISYSTAATEMQIAAILGKPVAMSDKISKMLKNSKEPYEPLALLINTYLKNPAVVHQTDFNNKIQIQPDLKKEIIKIIETDTTCIKDLQKQKNPDYNLIYTKILKLTKTLDQIKDTELFDVKPLFIKTILNFVEKTSDKSLSFDKKNDILKPVIELYSTQKEFGESSLEQIFTFCKFGEALYLLLSPADAVKEVKKEIIENATKCYKKSQTLIEAEKDKKTKDSKISELNKIFSEIHSRLDSLNAAVLTLKHEEQSQEKTNNAAPQLQSDEQKLQDAASQLKDNVQKPQYAASSATSVTTVPYNSPYAGLQQALDEYTEEQRIKDLKDIEGTTNFLGTLYDIGVNPQYMSELILPKPAPRQQLVGMAGNKDEDNAPSKTFKDKKAMFDNPSKHSSESSTPHHSPSKSQAAKDILPCQWYLKGVTYKDCDGKLQESPDSIKSCTPSFIHQIQNLRPDEQMHTLACIHHQIVENTNKKELGAAVQAIIDNAKFYQTILTEHKHIAPNDWHACLEGMYMLGDHRDHHYNDHE